MQIFRKPIMEAETPIIPPERQDQFLQEVFHNFEELVIHHKRLVETLHEIQLEQHPRITSITAAIFDAALNFREAYMEYIPNYPIATYRIEEEMRSNPDFRLFVQVRSLSWMFSSIRLQCLERHPPPRRVQAGDEGVYQPSHPSSAAV